MRNSKSSETNNFEYQADNQLIQPIKFNESWAGRRLMEALSHLPDLGGSLDMRFQQRQQQEKEQRRLELTKSGNGNETETLATRNTLSTAKPNIGNGKVRQMFDERRRGAGIDRSNPLKPITASSKSISTPTLTQKGKTNKVHGVRSQESVGEQITVTTRKTTVTRQVNNNRTSRSITNTEIIGEQNNNALKSDLNDIDDLDSETMPKGFYTDGDRNRNDSNNNNNSSQKKSPTYNGSSAHSANSPHIKLNPVLTKKSPQVRNSTNSTPTLKKSNGTTQSIKTELTASARSTNKTQPSFKSPPASARKMASPQAPSTPKGSPPAGMVSCKFCGRNFNEDRIVKHEQICQKMASSKRKIFDASKHRIKGTEAEQYSRKKPPSRAPAPQRSSNYISAAAATGQTIAPKKSNWRQKHEEFIAAIRAAKQVQAHLARGGKLSDLPPPPPSENPDYIQCPHCLRRFNETAAERHIPKCATMLHNKPKPPGTMPQKRR